MEESKEAKPAAEARTKEQIDKEYSEQAMLLGHKARIQKQLSDQVDLVEAEMNAHLDALIALNAESMKLIEGQKA